jgi:hypothetical protein
MKILDLPLKKEKKKICLTFDDGPHKVFTPIILDILKEYNITYDYHGIWDEKQRKFIYMYIVKNGLQNKYKDLLAYLDKDVERTFDIEYIVDKKDGSKKENDTWLIQ